MKKLVVAAVAAVAGLVAWKKIQQGRNEQALWSEATDSVTPPATTETPATSSTS